MKDAVLSIYLSVYLSICMSVSIPIDIGPLKTPPHPTLPYPTNNTHPYPYPILPLSLAKLDRNDSGPKRLNYLGRNNPPQKLAETTQAEMTRIPLHLTRIFMVMKLPIFIWNAIQITGLCQMEKKGERWGENGDPLYPAPFLARR